MRTSLHLLSAVLLAVAHGVVGAPSAQHPTPVVRDTAASSSTSSSSYTPAASDTDGKPLAECAGCNNTGNNYPSPPAVQSTDPHVTTSQGVYAGQYLPGLDASETFSGIGIENPQDIFLGIPYAKPPVGSRRFRRPSPLDSDDKFNDTRPAKRRAFQCMGVGASHNYNPPLIEIAIGEDCLALDVIRPAGTKASDKLPVLVYIHGGGFNQGGTADRRYNGSWIVDRSVQMGTPVIYVGLQYRLDALGFPFGYDAAELNITNLGLYDQRVALHWLRKNIDHFGGDKDKVTIMGESAGAASIYVHYTAYGGKDENLFRAAVAHSGYFALSSAGEEAREAKMQNFTQLLGCGGKEKAEETYDCLRDVDFAKLAAVERETFAAAGAGTSFSPVVDGDLVKVDLQEAFEEGMFVRRPLISQSNTDEGESARAVGVTRRVHQRLTYPSLTHRQASPLETTRSTPLRRSSTISTSSAGSRIPTTSLRRPRLAKKSSLRTPTMKTDTRPTLHPTASWPSQALEPWHVEATV